MLSMDGDILLINFIYILLKLVDWKDGSIVNVSVSDPDLLFRLVNISYNVRHLYFVLDMFWEKLANERPQMILTNGGHKTIVSRNMVKELAGICVNISQKCCVYTLGYMKQGVGVSPPNGARFSSDQSDNVQSCFEEAWY